jgi:hypothetical protein
LRAAMAAPRRPLISGVEAGSAAMHASQRTWRGLVTAPPHSGPRRRERCSPGDLVGGARRPAQPTRTRHQPGLRRRERRVDALLPARQTPGASDVVSVPRDYRAADGHAGQGALAWRERVALRICHGSAATALCHASSTKPSDCGLVGPEQVTLGASAVEVLVLEGVQAKALIVDSALGPDKT